MPHKHFQRCDSGLIKKVNLGLLKIIAFTGNQIFSNSKIVLIFFKSLIKKLI